MSKYVYRRTNEFDTQYVNRQLVTASLLKITFTFLNYGLDLFMLAFYILFIYLLFLSVCLCGTLLMYSYFCYMFK